MSGGSVTIQVSAIDGIKLPAPPQRPLPQAAPQPPQGEPQAPRPPGCGRGASPQQKTAFVAFLKAVQNYHRAESPADKAKWKKAAERLHAKVGGSPQMMSRGVEWRALLAAPPDDDFENPPEEKKPPKRPTPAAAHDFENPPAPAATKQPPKPAGPQPLPKQPTAPPGVTPAQGPTADPSSAAPRSGKQPTPATPTTVKPPTTGPEPAAPKTPGPDDAVTPSGVVPKTEDTPNKAAGGGKLFAGGAMSPEAKSVMDATVSRNAGRMSGDDLASVGEKLSAHEPSDQLIADVQRNAGVAPQAVDAELRAAVADVTEAGDPVDLEEQDEPVAIRQEPLDAYSQAGNVGVGTAPSVGRQPPPGASPAPVTGPSGSLTPQAEAAADAAAVEGIIGSDPGEDGKIPEDLDDGDMAGAMAELRNFRGDQFDAEDDNEDGPPTDTASIPNAPEIDANGNPVPGAGGKPKQPPEQEGEPEPGEQKYKVPVQTAEGKKVSEVEAREAVREGTPGMPAAADAAKDDPGYEVLPDEDQPEAAKRFDAGGTHALTEEDHAADHPDKLSMTAYEKSLFDKAKEAHGKAAEVQKAAKELQDNAKSSGGASIFDLIGMQDHLNQMAGHAKDAEGAIGEFQQSRKDRFEEVGRRKAAKAAEAKKAAEEAAAKSQGQTTAQKAAQGKEGAAVANDATVDDATHAARKKAVRDHFMRDTEPPGMNAIGRATAGIQNVTEAVRAARALVGGRTTEAVGRVGNVLANTETAAQDRRIVEQRKREANIEAAKWESLADRVRTGTEITDDEAAAAKRSIKRLPLDGKQKVAAALGVKNAENMDTDRLNVAVDRLMDEVAPKNVEKHTAYVDMQRQHEGYVGKIKAGKGLTEDERRSFRRELRHLDPADVKKLAGTFDGLDPRQSRDMLIQQMQSVIDDSTEAAIADHEKNKDNAGHLASEVGRLRLATDPDTGEDVPEAPLSKKKASDLKKLFASKAVPEAEKKRLLAKLGVTDADDLKTDKGMNDAFSDAIARHTLKPQTRGKSLQTSDNYGAASDIARGEKISHESGTALLQSLPKDEQELRSLADAMGVPGSKGVGIDTLRVRMRNMIREAMKADEEDGASPEEDDSQGDDETDDGGGSAPVGPTTPPQSPAGKTPEATGKQPGAGGVEPPFDMPPESPAAAEAPPKKAGGDEMIDVGVEIAKAGGQSNRAFDAIRSKIASHLADGGRASIWMDGKRTPVGKAENGRLYDDKGNPIGMMPLAMGQPGSKTGIELHAGDTPTPGESRKVPEPPAEAGGKSIWDAAAKRGHTGSTNRKHPIIAQGKTPEVIHEYLSNAAYESPERNRRRDAFARLATLPGNGLRERGIVEGMQPGVFAAAMDAVAANMDSGRGLWDGVPEIIEADRKRMEGNRPTDQPLGSEAAKKGRQATTYQPANVSEEKAKASAGGPKPAAEKVGRQKSNAKPAEAPKTASSVATGDPKKDDRPSWHPMRMKESQRKLTKAVKELSEGDGDIDKTLQDLGMEDEDLENAYEAATGEDIPANAVDNREALLASLKDHIEENRKQAAEMKGVGDPEPDPDEFDEEDLTDEDKDELAKAAAKAAAPEFKPAVTKKPKVPKTPSEAPGDKAVDDEKRMEEAGAGKPWHGGRDEVFEAMRQQADRNAREFEQAKRLGPTGGSLSVGSADFDHTLKGTVGEAYVRALRNGKTPDEALEEAKADGRDAIRKWNERGSKSRVSMSGGGELKRWEGSADDIADTIHRRFKSFDAADKPKGEPAAPAKEPDAANPGVEKDGEGNHRGVIKLPGGETFKGKWREGDATPEEAKEKAFGEYVSKLRLDHSQKKHRSQAESVASEREMKEKILAAGRENYPPPEGRPPVVATHEQQDGHAREYRIQPKWDNVSGLHYVGVYDVPKDGISAMEVTPKHESYDAAAADLAGELDGLRHRENVKVHDPVTGKAFKARQDERTAKAEEARRAEEKKRDDERERSKKRAEASERIDGIVKSAKGKKQTYAISSGSGTKPVSGTVYGPFGVHKSDDDGKDPYAVTHVKSGMLAGRFKTLADAKKAAVLSGVHGDWDFSDPKKMGKEAREHGSAVIRDVRSGELENIADRLDKIGDPPTANPPATFQPKRAAKGESAEPHPVAAEINALKDRLAKGLVDQSEIDGPLGKLDGLSAADLRAVADQVGAGATAKPSATKKELADLVRGMVRRVHEATLKGHMAADGPGGYKGGGPAGPVTLPSAQPKKAAGQAAGSNKGRVADLTAKAKAGGLTDEEAAAYADGLKDMSLTELNYALYEANLQSNHQSVDAALKFIRRRLAGQ